MASMQYLKRVASILRRTSPYLYDKAVLTVFSEPARSAYALPRLLADNRLIKRNHPRFAVNLSLRMGLGAHMTWTAGILAYCAENHLSPRLIFTNPVYAVNEGQDWLDQYFVRKQPLCDDEGVQALEFDKYQQQSMNVTRRIRPSYQALTLNKIGELFFGALAFRDELQEEAKNFCRTKGISTNTIGVHFRGTDKRLEATRVEWGEIASAVDLSLSHGAANIFVATDEPEFVSFMANRFSKNQVLDLGCKEIYSGSPAHLTPGDNRIKASEAIRTMLVLSQCGQLFRTRSHLSAWAKILNPTIPTIVFGKELGGDLRGFPENLIHTSLKA